MRLLISSLICFIFLSAVTIAVGQDGTDSCSGDDYEATLQKFTRNAEEGDPSAQFLLGLMYAEGKGVQRDLPEAYFWLNMSAELGNEDASILLATLIKKMTSDQIISALNYKKK